MIQNRVTTTIKYVDSQIQYTDINRFKVFYFRTIKKDCSDIFIPYLILIIHKS